MTLDPLVRAKIIASQKNEITEHVIYSRLARMHKDPVRAKALAGIAADEKEHYVIWRSITGEEVQPDPVKTNYFVFLARLFGLTFGLKLLEKGEDKAQDFYSQLVRVSPQVQEIIADEGRHEKELIDMIGEERLQYVSSVVLGLNDALVELTGALVGFTLALQNTRLVGIVGLITGIAASLSMAASEYLSTKQEDTKKDPLKASLITGAAYVLTVVLLILPYLFFKNIFVCLGLVVAMALCVIFVFTYYISVAKELDFRKRFIEMAGISLGVAALNFLIGLAVRAVFKIEA